MKYSLGLYPRVELSQEVLRNAIDYSLSYLDEIFPEFEAQTMWRTNGLEVDYLSTLAAGQYYWDPTPTQESQSDIPRHSLD